MPLTSPSVVLFGDTDLNPLDLGRVSSKGGSTNDKLSSGLSTGASYKDFQQFYGGAGNDTFILKAKDFGGATQYGVSKYITDFQGAGGHSATSNDFLGLSGFGAGSSLSLVDSKPGTGANVILTYEITDGVSGATFKILVNSVNGQELGAGDYAFY